MLHFAPYQVRRASIHSATIDMIASESESPLYRSRNMNHHEYMLEVQEVHAKVQERRALYEAILAKNLGDDKQARASLLASINLRTLQELSTIHLQKSATNESGNASLSGAAGISTVPYLHYLPAASLPAPAASAISNASASASAPPVRYASVTNDVGYTPADANASDNDGTNNK